MSKAVNPFGPEGEGPDRPETHEVDDDTPDWRKGRERGVWYAVAGIGLMFAGSISAALGIGGAFMVLFGIFEYIRWTLKRPKDDDPWRDPDLDAWEEAHYGEDADEPVEGPNIRDEEPESALGLDRRF